MSVLRTLGRRKDTETGDAKRSVKPPTHTEISKATRKRSAGSPLFKPDPKKPVRSASQLSGPSTPAKLVGEDGSQRPTSRLQRKPVAAR